MSMRVPLVLAIGLLIAGFGLVTADDKDDGVKKDMKLLEGTWVMQSFENQGKPTPADELKSIKLTIKGDKYLVDLPNRKIEMTFKIDPAKKPKAIDFTLTTGEEKAVTQGIYEVTADTLKVCRTTESGKDRPTGFATKEGSGTAIAIYKREKK